MSAMGRNVARAWLPVLLGAPRGLAAPDARAPGSGNTLHANGRWESTKVGLDHGILGAVSFVATRTALHRDRLDLGVWHGFHELLLREPVTLERLSLRFRLRRGGWLAVISAHDGARFEAVRVSRGPGLSARLPRRERAAGAFTAKRPLALPDPGRGWHALALVREGRRAAGGARRRGARTLSGVAAGAGARRLARLRSRTHVEVDDVRVESATPPGVLVEDFANHRRAGRSSRPLSR